MFFINFDLSVINRFTESVSRDMVILLSFIKRAGFNQNYNEIEWAIDIFQKINKFC